MILLSEPIYRRIDIKTIQRKFEAFAPTFTERGRRIWAATEAQAVGYGVMT